MYMLSLVLALIFTVFLCLSAILIEWIIAQIGVTFFVFILMVSSLVFLLMIGERHHGQ